MASWAPLGAGLLFSRTVILPLRQIASGMEAFSRGENEIQLPLNAADEAGVLARSFDTMISRVNEHTASLEAEIVERERAEHERDRFFTLSLDVMCIIGLDGYFKRVNPAFERTLGWSTEELLGRPFIDLVHDEDVETTQLEVEKLARGIPTISFKNRFRCADGSYRYLRWTSHPEPDTGLLYAVARDITEIDEERQRTEKEIRSLEDRLEEAESRLRETS